MSTNASIDVWRGRDVARTRGAHLGASIAPAPQRRDVTTPREHEVRVADPGGSPEVQRMNSRTMFIRTSTINRVSVNPKSSDREPIRKGGMSRRKNRMGGSVTV